MDFCSIQRIIMYYCHSFFFSAQITQDLASQSLHADSYVPLMYPHYSLNNSLLSSTGRCFRFIFYFPCSMVSEKFLICFGQKRICYVYLLLPRGQCREVFSAGKSYECVYIFIYHICQSSVDLWQTPWVHTNTLNSSLDFSISASHFNSEQIGSYYSQHVDWPICSILEYTQNSFRIANAYHCEKHTIN